MSFFFSISCICFYLIFPGVLVRFLHHPGCLPFWESFIHSALGNIISSCKFGFTIKKRFGLRRGNCSTWMANISVIDRFNDWAWGEFTRSYRNFRHWAPSRLWYAYQRTLILWFTLLFGQFIKLMDFSNRSKFGTLVISCRYYINLKLNLLTSGGIVMWWAVWRCHS